ncbi:tetratricopeptide repeat protein [Babesia caballi]|uniref:Tetratricopeptide repeat protein n=1 Tax=Babesia caballi TaxID=5871 RepID=A0AAV4LZ67_BABCB|nr:tetratricopeptide repeat protein [Babesia caballi]
MDRNTVCHSRPGRRVCPTRGITPAEHQAILYNIQRTERREQALNAVLEDLAAHLRHGWRHQTADNPFDQRRAVLEFFCPQRDTDPDETPRDTVDATSAEDLLNRISETVDRRARQDYHDEILRPRFGVPSTSRIGLDSDCYCTCPRKRKRPSDEEDPVDSPETACWEHDVRRVVDPDDPQLATLVGVDSIQ